MKQVCVVETAVTQFRGNRFSGAKACTRERVAHRQSEGGSSGKPKCVTVAPVTADVDIEQAWQEAE